MSLDINNTDKLNVFRQDLDRMDIPLHPPCMNRSEVEFSVEFEEDAGAVRYALAAIKNVGKEAMAGIVQERTENGNFKNLVDFASRLNPRNLNKRQAENLTRAGAFDSLQADRAQVFASLENLLRHAQQMADERGSGQVNLFGGAESRADVAPVMIKANRWTSMELLKQEFDAVGFYLSGHPLDAYAKTLDKAGVRSSVAFFGGLSAAESAAKLAGTVMAKRQIKTKKGKALAFITLSDASGAFEVTMFEETLNQCQEILNVGSSLVLNVNGHIDMENEQPRVTAQSAQRLETVAAQTGDGVRIFMDDDSPLNQIAGILEKTGPGRGRVAFVLNLKDEAKEVELDLSSSYSISPEVRQALKYVPGVLDVHDI